MAVNKSFKTLEQSHYDLSKIPPLEPNRLVGFINHFNTAIIDSLRDLEQATDTKFLNLERRIKTCRKNLQILESRLDSIPFLKATEYKTVVTSTGQIGGEPPEIEQSDSQSQDGNQEQEQETTESNPLLEKYYRMLKVGVPLEAVRIKMISEDLDPQLLVLH